jgi:hypothetical protein
MVEGIPYDDSEKPSYDQGREVIQEEARSSAEIMANNPPFHYNYNATNMGREDKKREEPA